MKPGSPYRPSNGTEGASFIDTHCTCCIHEQFIHTQDHKSKKCRVLSESMYHGHCKEWVYDENGEPSCIEKKHWDWGYDDDSDGLKNPNIPPEPVPDNQLSMFPTDEQVEEAINAPLPPLIKEIETLVKALQNESTSSM